MSEPELKSTILVVDDTEANREGLRRRLERRGYTVLEAKDGAEALAMIADRPFDLILLDVMMPGISGLDVLKKVRESRPPAELPIIMATAKDATEDVVGALNLGANDYVTKPLDFPIVLARVQTQLSLRHSVKQIVELEKRLKERNAELEESATRTRRELETAARVQEAFLPQKSPQVSGLKFAWCFRPCDQLAGDSLNIVQLDRDTTAVYVLDVAGHGAASALLAVASTRMLSPGPDSILIRGADHERPGTIASPREVVERLDKSFRWNPELEQFLTICYCTINTKTRELTYASAAHPAAVRVTKAGETSLLLEGSGLPIGYGEGYSNTAVALAPGDRVFLYSDGIVEAMNADRELFGKDRLLEAMSRGAADSLDGGVSILLEAVEAWSAGERSRDDISVLAVEIE